VCARACTHTHTMMKSRNSKITSARTHARTHAHTHTHTQTFSTGPLDDGTDSGQCVAPARTQVSPGIFVYLVWLCFDQIFSVINDENITKKNEPFIFFFSYVFIILIHIDSGQSVAPARTPVSPDKHLFFVYLVAGALYVSLICMPYTHAGEVSHELRRRWSAGLPYLFGGHVLRRQP